MNSAWIVKAGVYAFYLHSYFKHHTALSQVAIVRGVSMCFWIVSSNKTDFCLWSTLYTL